MGALPQEDDPPLLVDADAMAVFQGAGEFFKAVAGWHAEVIEFGGSMQLVELHLGAMLDLAGKFAAPHQAEDLLGISIGKALDHARKAATTGNRTQAENYQKQEFCLTVGSRGRSQWQHG